MHNMMRHVGALGGLVLLFAALATWAQETVRVRGTIEGMDGHTLLVKSRDGPELKVMLTDHAVVIGLVKSSVSDIKPGSYVGVTGVPQPDGSQKALEVHIFPESMRGTGEGHRPFSVPPQSTMTNANVEQTVGTVEGQMLTLKHKDGETKIMIPPDTPIVTYVVSDKSELRPEVKIVVPAAKKLPDGTLEAARVNFGKDGFTPPM